MINIMPTINKALEGVRVLDFTQIGAVPLAGMQMGDMGAEVIKVEAPGGDIGRKLGPPWQHGESVVSMSFNRNKRSLIVDLKKPGGAALILRLARSTDVVLESFRPGVMARLGLDYETLRTHKPDLVMCAISGYGQTGPAADRPAFAPIVQAWSGYETVTLGYQPGLTKPLNMGLPVADTTAALQAYGAVMAALFHHARTGEGQFIDIAMPGGKTAPHLAKRGIRGVRTLTSDITFLYFNMEDPVVCGLAAERVALRRAGRSVAAAGAWDAELEEALAAWQARPVMIADRDIFSTGIWIAL